MENHNHNLRQPHDWNEHLEKKYNEALVHSLLTKETGISWMLDKNQNLVYANETFNQYFSLQGHKPQANFYNKVPEELINIFKRYYSEVIETGKRISTEASVTTADGQEVVFSMELFPVENNLVGGYAIKSTDDNKRKQLEYENQRLLNLVHVASNAIWE